jgi:hypothetical protein
MLQTYLEQWEKQDASFNSVVDKNATMSRETHAFQNSFNYIHCI